jgi:hypothetical protein
MAEPELKTDSQPTQSVLLPADSLDLIVDQWYQAILTGDDGQAGGLERDIVRLLTIDINQTQSRLTKLMEKSRLEQTDTNPSFAKVDSEDNPLHGSIDFLRSTLNVKKILLGSISNSDAFSNKYRLLGDYVELIRREVGLPKLKLASEKRAEPQKN